MRWTFARAAFLLLLTYGTALTAAWSKDDHEIFRLKDEIQLHEGGPNATFYTFLNVPPRASRDEITKAYRKLSRALHPDKARSNWLANYDKPPPPTKQKEGAKPTVHVHRPKKPSSNEIARFNKVASARFERLSLVANILRGPLRERYDHFLAHGFPTWRGTGYYYARFRPGLGTVLTGLFVFVGGGAHYVALWLGWKRRREFVERYVRHARRMAWGDEGGIGAIPGLGGPTVSGERNGGFVEEAEESVAWNRRQKRAMEKEKRREGKPGAAGGVKSMRAANNARTEGISAPRDAEVILGPVGAKKRTVAENGKILIVDSVGHVFLEEETEEGDVQEFLLDPDEVPPPTLADTFLVRGPKFAYRATVGRYLSKSHQPPEHVVWEARGQGEQKLQEDEAEVALHSAVSGNANGEARKRKTKARM